MIGCLLEAGFDGFWHSVSEGRHLYLIRNRIYIHGRLAWFIDLFKNTTNDISFKKISQCQLLSCWIWSFVRIKPRMIFWLKLIMSINFSCHGLNLCINQPIYKIKYEWALHINVIFPLNWKDILGLYLGTSELYGSHIKDYRKPNLSLKKLEIL